MNAQRGASDTERAWGRPVAVCVVLLAVVFGCGPASRPAATSGSPHEPLTLLVAASTKEPVEELAARFRRAHAVEVRVVADDSSKLAQQIVHGAPAAAFLSAAVRWADHLEAQGLVARRRNLLGNELVIVVPKGNPRQVRAPEDLAGPNVATIALAGPTVPAGAYARQALVKLGLLARLEEQRRIVSGENVRAASAFVERGEADAAIVYRTDARVSSAVETVFAFPSDTHEPIVYPWVLLQAPGSSRASDSTAVRLYEYLGGPDGAAVFRAHGFTWLSP